MPEGASVVVDGRPVAASSTVDVLPGIHAVSIRRAGREQRIAVDAPAGVLTPVGAEAEVSPAPAPPPIAAAPQAPVDPRLVSSPSAAGRTTTVLALGGAALLTIAGGVYFTLAARDAQETSDQLQIRMRSDDLSCKRSGSLCEDYESARSASSRSSVLGTSLLVSGGVLGGAAVAAWVLWPAATTRVAPMAAKDGGGVTVVGRF